MTQFEPSDDGFEVLSATPRRLSRRTHQVLVAAIAALLVIAGGTWWLDHRGSTVTITFAGAPIDDPGGVLDTATARFESYTQANAGRMGQDARCWFQRAAATTDVQRTVLCGPVQFYDGIPTKPYLSLPLYPGSGRPVQLQLGAPPSVPETVAALAGITLVRPGGTTVPRSTAGVATPVPPAASSTVLTATDAVHPVALARASPSSLIGADFSTVRLQAYGTVAHFGSGATERSAPAGRQLLAFRLAFGGGENGFALLDQVHLGVSVGADAIRPLRLNNDLRRAGQLFVVAVAKGEPVSVDLTENRITQSLSLRTGRPAAGNITILRTGRIDGAYLASGIATASVTERGHHTTAMLYLSILGARTGFFIPGTGQHPRSTHDMFLSLDVDYYLARLPANLYRQFGLAEREVTVTPLGGRPVHGTELPGGSGHVVFEVPATMVEATVSIAGSAATKAFSMTIATPLHLRLRLNR